VKERLLCTSDRVHDLERDVKEGHVLNLTRALDVGRDYVLLDKRGPFHGILAEHPGVEPGGPDDARYFDSASVLRITLTKEGSHAAYLEQPGGNPLVEKVDVSGITYYLDTGTGIVEFTGSEIKDLIARFHP
jgi:hypothetical protein